MMNDLHSYEYHNLARNKVLNKKGFSYHRKSSFLFSCLYIYILLSIHQLYPNACHEVMNRIRKYCTSKDEKEPYQA